MRAREQNREHRARGLALKSGLVKIMDASVSRENDYHGCHERNQKWGFNDIVDLSRFFAGPQIKVLYW